MYHGDYSGFYDGDEDYFYGHGYDHSGYIYSNWNVGYQQKRSKPTKERPPSLEKLQNLLQACKPEVETKKRRTAIRKFLRESEYWLDHWKQIKKYTDHHLFWETNHNNFYSKLDTRSSDPNRPKNEIVAEARAILNPVPPVEDLVQISKQYSSEASHRAHMLLKHMGFRDNGRYDTPPPIVQYARAGNLKYVKAYVEAGANVDESLQWTEVQEKWGYDKSWDWDGDSALLAAAREGHEEIVRYLLGKGANRTHRCCVVDDVYETPVEAARKKGFHKIADLIEDPFSGKVNVEVKETENNVQSGNSEFPFVKVQVKDEGENESQEARSSFQVEIKTNQEIVKQEHQLFPIKQEYYYDKTQPKTFKCEVKQKETTLGKLVKCEVRQQGIEDRKITVPITQTMQE
eukprot:TRINITY_DN23842_c0_g1_i5.p1 TRINITY_DN23842_c0_g1~~TRINITY_DN23842_c0_g1_i5.p1  ORF type:complete len:402 (+),score=51.04 TRINITY_DN23842_c0_g1_i5:55-1260(+)